MSDFFDIINRRADKKARADIRALGARVDNIIAHNNDTEGNTELIDIRTGADETVYTSAGAAVRGQVKAIEEYTSSIVWEDGYINSSGAEAIDPYRKRTCFIPCPENITINYKAETNHSNVSALTAYDINKTVIATNVNIGKNNREYTYTTPQNTRFVRISSKKEYETSVSFPRQLVFANFEQEISDTLSMRQDMSVDHSTAFVAVDGNDTNSGDASHPFATVNKALQSRANVIILNEGVYEQTINLSYAIRKNIHIINGSPTGRVIFRAANSRLTSKETLVQNYTKVYYANVNVAFHANNKWIFQDGVPDETTLIENAERLPLQRGYVYRCEDTKIEKCSSQTVEEALAEIENSNEYKWFYDSSESKLYFSRPESVSASKPLRASFGGGLFSNTNRGITLNISGIEAKYLAFNISKTSNSIISDCKASNVFGAGAFQYDQCVNATFERCEATRCFTGSNGDGFNGHSVTTGDARAKQTTVTLTDCWSHDNNDDGYSDHERAECTIIGGLYEYNGKAGITPAFGSHCNCYNVHARHNYNGFYYIGTVSEAEGGKYGQLYCNSCVAENNTEGGEIQAGFCISGAGNRAVLVNCKSIGNNYGYYADPASYDMMLIDCGAKDNTHIKQGNITVQNTNIVE